MKKIASGDGWFDLQMSAEERANLLHGLNFALKNYEHLDDLETPPPDFIKEGIRVLKEKTKPAKDQFVSRFNMSEYMHISETLWSMLATITANQINLALLEPKLNVDQLRITEKAFHEAMPDNEVTPEFYAKDRRKDLYESEAIGEGKDGKKTP